MTTSKAQPLEDRHVQLNISPRLVTISRALKKKSQNRLVALYIGFDTLEKAQRCAAWIQVNCNKSNFEVIVRKAQRCKTSFEIKVRRPSEAMLQALIKKDAAAQTNNPEPNPESLTVLTPKRGKNTITPETHPNSFPQLAEIANAHLIGRKSPTKFRGLSID